MNSVAGSHGTVVGRAGMSRPSGLPQARAAHGVASGGTRFVLRGDGVGNAVRGTGDLGVGRGLPGALDWSAPAEGVPRLHLLVVDEDEVVRSACAEIGRRMGMLVVEAADFNRAQAIIRQQKVDVLLLDLKMSGEAGRGRARFSLLEEVKALYPEMPVIAMTSAGSVGNAVEAMRLGAADYLTKPFDVEQMVTRLERASQQTHLHVESRLLRDRLRTQRASGPLIGNSPEMEKLYRILSKVAHSTHPVLITGEHGTGKELVARSIHFNGPQSSRPFLPVDCGAITPTLIEGELFGYVKGANPARLAAGGGAGKDGLLVSAAGGTIFLDDVAELSLDLQAKLVRVLHEKAVLPIGGTQTVPLAARVVAATNADLAALVEQGKFRRDLYFRLNVVSLRIPALRQRMEDIPELAQYFMDRMQRDTGTAHTLSDEALRVMMSYDWPANVRELESAIERACAMSSGPVLHLADLPTQLRQEGERMQAEMQVRGAAVDALGRNSPDKIQSIAELEKHAILGTIRHLRGDKLLAAKLLGIGKTTLYRKLKEYGMQEWEGTEGHGIGSRGQPAGKGRRLNGVPA